MFVGSFSHFLPVAIGSQVLQPTSINFVSFEPNQTEHMQTFVRILFTPMLTMGLLIVFIITIFTLVFELADHFLNLY